MTISFNQIPSSLRVPFVYTEFDNSRAVQGAQSQPYKVLLMGQRRSSGTVSASIPTRITSPEQAGTYFGLGSMLHEMAKAFFLANKFTECWAVAIDDNGSGVAATGKLTITGPASKAGTLALYFGGTQVTVGVASGDTASAIATAVAAAITAKTDLPITAAVNGDDNFEVDLTFRHKGLTGNYLDVRLNYNSDDVLPAGVGVAITAMADGATDPDVAAAIAAIGDIQYNVIAFPYTGSANLALIEAELAERFGPLTQNDGMAFSASNVSHGNLSTLGNSRNSPHLSILGCTKIPWGPWRVAASVAGIVAYHMAIDPARPLQTLELAGCPAPFEKDLFTLSERNILLFDGISTFTRSSGGTVLLERVITTYKTNPAGADDPSYLDVETLFTLSYLRWDWRNTVLRKYPRHKLAKDGIRIAPGQAIVTPKVMKGELVAKARQWEELGLVEGVDAFKESLIVEINGGDPNRLDIDMSPDLVNQFRVNGNKIAFLL